MLLKIVTYLAKLGLAFPVNTWLLNLQSMIRKVELCSQNINICIEPKQEAKKKKTSSWCWQQFGEVQKEADTKSGTAQ